MKKLKIDCKNLYPEILHKNNVTNDNFNINNVSDMCFNIEYRGDQSEFQKLLEPIRDDNTEHEDMDIDDSDIFYLSEIEQRYIEKEIYNRRAIKNIKIDKNIYELLKILFFIFLSLYMVRIFYIRNDFRKKGAIPKNIYNYVYMIDNVYIPLKIKEKKKENKRKNVDKSIIYKKHLDRYKKIYEKKYANKMFCNICETFNNNDCNCKVFEEIFYK